MGAGGSVSGKTVVTQAQALETIRAAFAGQPHDAAKTLEEVLACCPAAPPPPGPPKSKPEAYTTTADEMHAWHKQPSKAKKLGTKIAGGSDHLSWKAALESGPLTRDARMSKIRTMFDAMDASEDHTVTEHEFIESLVNDGVASDAAAALFKAMDETHTKKLSLTKFEHYCSCHTLQIIRDSFKQLDPSHDRQVDKKEFKKYFLGNGLSKEQVGTLWDTIDANRNGKVSFVEYRDWAQDTLTVSSLEDVAASLGMSFPC